MSIITYTDHDKKAQSNGTALVSLSATHTGISV